VSMMTPKWVTVDQALWGGQQWRGKEEGNLGMERGNCRGQEEGNCGGSESAGVQSI
jgi:hypothetical protein